MPSAQPRPRNAAATRAAILQSAIEHFAGAGYDGAGVRQIAKDAGVTAMLVNRYFGSKEQLFAEAVEAAPADGAAADEGEINLDEEEEEEEEERAPLEEAAIAVKSVPDAVFGLGAK